METKVRASVVAGSVFLLFIAGISSAGSASALDPVPPPPEAAVLSASAPGPNDLTWDQLVSMNFSGDYSVGLPSAYSAERTVKFGVVGSCHLDTREVYKRKSGSGFPYGGVGLKPKTTCTTGMKSIKHATALYKTVWWGLQQVHVPFTGGNYGAASYEQKNVLVKCADLSYTHFIAIVNSIGVFPNGATGTGSAWEEAKLSCGAP